MWNAELNEEFTIRKFNSAFSIRNSALLLRKFFHVLRNAIEIAL